MESTNFLSAYIFFVTKKRERESGSLRSQYFLKILFKKNRTPREFLCNFAIKILISRVKTQHVFSPLIFRNECKRRRRRRRRRSRLSPLARADEKAANVTGYCYSRLHYTRLPLFVLPRTSFVPRARAHEQESRRATLIMCLAKIFPRITVPR